jgi:hypothetical protein
LPSPGLAFDPHVAQAQKRKYQNQIGGKEMILSRFNKMLHHIFALRKTISIYIIFNRSAQPHMEIGCGGNVTFWQQLDDCAAKNIASLEADPWFFSVYDTEPWPHKRNNWIWQDFNVRRIEPPQYSIRTFHGGRARVT